MPLVRCRNYNDDGSPIGRGCLHLGTCNFVHPSEPRWMDAPRIMRGRGGFAGGGRGRGRGSFNKGSFNQGLSSATGANAPLPTPFTSKWGAPASAIPANKTSADSDFWAGLDGSGSSGVPPTSAPDTASSFGANTTAWGGPPASAASETPGGASDSWGDAAIGGWGGTGATTSGWAEASTSGWGDNVASSSGWGQSSADPQPMAVEDTSLEPTAPPPTPQSSGWAAATGETAQLDVEVSWPSNPPQPSMPPPPPPVDSPRGERLGHMSFDKPSVARLGRSSREPASSDVASSSSSRSLIKIVPKLVRQRREAVGSHVRRLQRAVYLRHMVVLAEEELTRVRRQQKSKQFVQLGHTARKMLDDKRIDSEERVYIAKGRLQEEVENLAELPDLGEYIKGLDPDAWAAEVANYKEEVKKWVGEVRPIVDNLVKKESAAMLERSSLEPDTIPPALDPVYTNIRGIESQVNDMQEEFYHQASLAFASVIDSKLEEKSKAFITASIHATLNARDDAMEEPLTELLHNAQAVDERLDTQAQQVASVIQDSDIISKDNEKLKEEFAKLWPSIQKNELAIQTNEKKLADARSELSQLAAQVEELKRSTNATPALAYDPNTLLSSLEPHVQLLVRRDVAPVLDRFHDSVLQQIRDKQEETVQMVWRYLQPIVKMSKMVNEFPAAMETGME